ncbi:MAG: class II glutamine amidotransferase [Polyangiaceae bacterium]
MCELLAIAARHPTTVRLSLDELARHGGETGPHADGWGLSLSDDRDVLIHRAPEAAAHSRWVKFFEEYQPRATLTIAHVRKATQGKPRLCNTQPFARELGGRMHVFAHNGMVPGIEQDARFPARRFRPVGETDSEHAFCALLEQLAPLYEACSRDELPALDARLERLAPFARELRTLGPANFLYSDGELIIAHAHKRTQSDGTMRPPGLHLLCRTCSAAADGVPLVGVSVEHADEQEVALAASVPLSDEPWEPMAEGEIAVLRGGRVERRIQT